MPGAESPLQTLRRFGLTPQKGLGQHFLVDRAAAEQIVRAALEVQPDGVIEIGPGLGILTRLLAASGLPVVAIERDEAMRGPLGELQAHFPNLTVHYEDVLATDLSALTALGRRAVIGNLPYQITSPLLEKLLTTTPQPLTIVITVQKEVGERLAARPGTRQYGALTLLADLYAPQPEVIRELAPGAFHPAPKVRSLVLRFTPRPDPLGNEARRQRFFRVVRAAFRQRRKQLRNALMLGLGLDHATATRALLAAGIEPQRRGETLSLEEFIALTDSILQATGQS